MTTKQRAKLRAMCNTLEPVLHIGKDGITENLVKQCWDALEARELIKVAVLNTAPFAVSTVKGSPSSASRSPSSSSRNGSAGGQASSRRTVA